jgi:hypothetical protein
LYNRLVKTHSSYSVDGLKPHLELRSKLQQQIRKYDPDGVKKQDALQRKVNKMRLSKSTLDSEKQTKRNELSQSGVDDINKYASENAHVTIEEAQQPVDVPDGAVIGLEEGILKGQETL